MPTNLVFIMTDNQAPWTLGCYGNQEILTPNVDRLAEEGMLFSNAYAVNSVCSPSRATFMTGLIPSQHGVHCYLGGEKPDAQMGPDAYCTIREFRNLPRVLSERGYECGLAGKWHLGDSIRPQEGFTYWFTKPRGHTHTFYDDEAIWQEEVYIEPRYFTDAITGHAVDFLRQLDGERPFFLYLAYNGPYGLGNSMMYRHENRYASYYEDKELECFPREAIHPWLHHNREIINNPVSIRGYASAVSGVDDGVGTVMHTLAELGLDDDTLVIFTADQGLAGGHHGMWGMGDHSRPIHTFEETIQIPLIFWQRDRIPAGKRQDFMTCNYDFFPSVLEHLGFAEEIPESPTLPGQSYAAALDGEDVERDETFFHEFENVRMIRAGEWKYTRRFPDGPDELYNMTKDPGEAENLVDAAACAPVVADLRKQIDEFFDRYADPKYDMWRGGISKAGRLIGE